MAFYIGNWKKIFNQSDFRSFSCNRFFLFFISFSLIHTSSLFFLLFSSKSLWKINRFRKRKIVNLLPFFFIQKKVKLKINERPSLSNSIIVSTKIRCDHQHWPILYFFFIDAAAAIQFFTWKKKYDNDSVDREKKDACVPSIHPSIHPSIYRSTIHGHHSGLLISWKSLI